jgi:hypothetical protein
VEKSAFARYLRGRQLRKSVEISSVLGVSKDEFEMMVKTITDDAIIDSYRICSHCRTEWITRREIENLIRDGMDSEKILNEIPSGHE